MRLTLEIAPDRAVLGGLTRTLTPQTLEELLINLEGEPEDPGSPSFDPRLVERGGEAWVRLLGDVVLRFEQKLLDPEASPELRERYLRKMRAVQRSLPAAAVTPVMPLYLKGHPEVIGHTMPYVDHLKLISDCSSEWGAAEATTVLLSLHSFIAECHDRGVILGEINPRNFGIGEGSFVAIDTLTFGVEGFPCETAYPPTLDPHLLDQDESINENSEMGWHRVRPYSHGSDWFGFACIVTEVLVGCGPWSGRHRLARECPALHRRRVRALRGLSFFDPSIELSANGLYRSPEDLSDSLYNHLYGVFNEGSRGVFPRALLEGERWLRSKEFRHHSSPRA